MKIIKESELIQGKDFVICYYRDQYGGYSFPCTESGLVDVLSLCPEAIDSYAKCVSGEFKTYGPAFVEMRPYRYICSAIGLCDVCGEEVVLQGFTCPCSCGADYNSSGQRLAPREQWGEETGECLADILKVA